MELAYSALGFMVGFVIGLSGIGGGSLMTPILVIVFNIKPYIAVGTDLLYAAITKSGGIFIHHKNNTINWRIVGLLSLGSIPTAIIALIIIKQSNIDEAYYEKIIIQTLSVALILTSFFLFTKHKLQHLSKNKKFSMIKSLHKKYCLHATVIAGAIIGILVTLSSVGAGVIGTAFLFLLYPHLRTISIIGTDLAHAIPITTIAGLGHASLGAVNFTLLGWLVIGSLPGILLGSITATRLPENAARIIMAIILLLIGVRLAFL